MWNAKSDKLLTETEQQLWPALTFWWDADPPRELYNNDTLEKWDWENPSSSHGLPEFFRLRDFGVINPSNDKNPAFIGGNLGDWREEFVLTSSDYTELAIFTTNIPTDLRIYTLPHNPAYRNAMNLKGYQQSHHVDYFSGNNMDTPAVPNIYYV